MARLVRQSLAVVRKEIRSELRNRFGLNTLGMFIVALLLVLLFSIERSRVTPGISAALLFISFYVLALSGLGRTFLAEEERGTMLLLRTATNAGAVFLGKLIYNVGISLVSNVLFALLYLLLVPNVWEGTIGGLMLATVVLSFGFAGAFTITSALLTRASEKGMLMAVLALPAILPLVVLGVEMLATGSAGMGVAAIGPELAIMTSYSIVLVALGFVLFTVIWKE